MSDHAIGIISAGIILITLYRLVYWALGRLTKPVAAPAPLLSPRASVVAHLKDGTAASGVLIEQRDGYLVLASPEVNEGDGPSTADGDLLVPLDAIRFIQRLGGSSWGS